MKFQGFVGPTYESRSKVADAQRCINLYPEIVESGSGKANIVLYRTPGLLAFLTLSSPPVRCLLETNGRAFAVAGNTFYEIFSDGTFTARGSVSASGRASMASNGIELVITSGSALHNFTLATNNFADIPSVTGDWVVFCDGYFIVVQPDTQVFWISAIYDGATWNGLDFSAAEAKPDWLEQAFSDHRELWLFGTETVQPYFNSGNADFPFEPISGAVLEIGAIAGSVQAIDNTLFWLGKGPRGRGIVWKAEGFRPMRISNHAVEKFLESYADIEDAISWVYDEIGHQFYVLSIPSATSSWVYDVATGMWHERDWWNPNTAAYEIHRGNCHCYAFGKHLVGDRETGVVYQMSLDYKDDDGDEIRWLRRAPHLANENKRIFYHSLEIDMETGVGLVAGQGSDPQIMMRFSNDGGRNWSNEKSASMGAMGKTGARVIWRQLGQGRDRVFEVYGTDPVMVAITDAFLELSGGTH